MTEKNLELRKANIYPVESLGNQFLAYDIFSKC